MAEIIRAVAKGCETIISGSGYACFKEKSKTEDYQRISNPSVPIIS